MNKRFLSAVLSAAVAASLMTGCADTEQNAAGSAEDDTSLSIVTTIFPEYDWVRNVLGDEDADITMLTDGGVDMHSFQPTADDIVKISECDLFIYAGGESDAWVEDALKQSGNENMKVIDLLDVLGDSVREEETVEGMEAEAEEEEGETEYDEHVWLSLKNAEVICDAIADSLAELDPGNAENYRSNASAYKDELAALDEEYQTAVDKASQNTLLFGDRFPFRYMVDDYGLNYYAAFAGCSAETEASFETVRFLAEKVDECGLKYVITLENSDQSIAETIIENTESKDQEIIQMNSMQSVTSDDIADGATYLAIMQENLNALKLALQA